VIEMRLADVATVTGGRLHRASGEERIATVGFDSRRLGAAALFAALPGERMDGHDFAAAAVASGAVAVLAGRPVDAPAVIVPPAPPGSLAARSYLAAGDRDGAGAAVLAALAALARDAVGRLDSSVVVAVTGSSGKTSTKDLLAAVLAPLGPTVAPAGSFNNELGVPLTVLRADAGTRHLVLEMSTRGPGHIASLCAIAPPRIGVVLNVGRAHLGEFGSTRGIAAAKAELVEALPPDGVAVLNVDDPAVAAMAGRTRARVLTVGCSTQAMVRAHEPTLDAGRPRFRLLSPAGQAQVALPLVGAHHVGNALAAAAVALELGATPAEVAQALAGARPSSRWRMEVTERPDGVTVVNDAYNANPESMRAALEALVALAGPRRTWAVLGRMAELGEAAPAAHAEVAVATAELAVDQVVAVAVPEYGARTVADPDAAVALLSQELRPGDVVLVKASRAAGLEHVATALLARPGEVAR